MESKKLDKYSLRIFEKLCVIEALTIQPIAKLFCCALTLLPTQNFLKRYLRFIIISRDEFFLDGGEAA